MKKILIFGLPGSGKTTLAKRLHEELLKTYSAVHLNGDEIRENLSKDLGFSREDRLENANRFRWLANKIIIGKSLCLCDFVCPLEEMRSIFDPDILIFMDTIDTGRFDDTNKMFQRLTEEEIGAYDVLTIDHFLDFNSNEFDQLLKTVKSKI
jgi:GTPase SAR1 family protein